MPGIPPREDDEVWIRVVLIDKKVEQGSPPPLTGDGEIDYGALEEKQAEEERRILEKARKPRLEGTSQGTKYEEPPENWIRNELVAFGAASGFIEKFLPSNCARCRRLYLLFCCRIFC